MKKMQIVLDEEKVRREGVHDLAKMQAFVDEILVDEGKLVKGRGRILLPQRLRGRLRRIHELGTYPQRSGLVSR